MWKAHFPQHFCYPDSIFGHATCCNYCYYDYTHESAFMAVRPIYVVLDSIVVSIPACHAGDRGSIPRRGGNVLFCIDIVS